MTLKEQESIVKSIARYSSSNLYKQVLRILNAFIKPKLLPPELYGLWNLLTLIDTYTLFSHQSSRISMQFLVPYHMGRNDQQTCAEIKSSVFLGTFYINAFIILILLIYAFFGDMNLKVRLGLITIAIITMMHWYTEYYFTLLKSHQKFKLISSANYLEATIALVFNVILIYYLNIYGVYLSAIMSEIMLILYLRAKYPLEKNVAFRVSVFIDLMKKGLPITLFNFSGYLVRSFDRIIVSYFLGIKQLGYYSIAVMVFSFLMQIPGASREVIEPRLMQSISTHSREDSMREYFFKPLINTAYFMPFLIGTVFFLFPLVVPVLLPKYIPGIVPTQIIIFGCYFVALSYITRGIIVANNWQFKSLGVLIFSLAVNIIISITLLHLGFGINGIAISSSISYLILFVGLMVFMRRKCNYALEDWKTNTIGLCWPFPIMCGIILILETIPKSMLINSITSSFFKLTIFYGAMFLVISIARKKYTLLKGFKLSDIF